MGLKREAAQVEGGREEEGEGREWKERGYGEAVEGWGWEEGERRRERK